MDTSGCGAVRLAHLFWEQGAGGSNPLTPTSLDKELFVFVKFWDSRKNEEKLKASLK